MLILLCLIVLSTVHAQAWRHYFTHVKATTREELASWLRAGNNIIKEAEHVNFFSESLMPIIQITQEKQSHPDTAISIIPKSILLHFSGSIQGLRGVWQMPQLVLMTSKLPNALSVCGRDVSNMFHCKAAESGLL